MWHGDWAKGPAGGFGTKETDWAGQYDVWEHKAGVIAENTKWTTDFTKNEGTIVYTIRQGVHFALDQTSAASRQVNGRELTADDVVAYLNRTITESTAYLFKTNLDLMKAVITKSGPWEVSVKVPLDALVTAVFRFGDVSFISPQELSKADWLKRENVVGSGPYIFKEYVPGSTMIMERNPNYWMKNPVGPGKGDQLPYIDRVQFLIVPDFSTRQAALRTSKFDQAGGYALEDANAMRKQVPVLKESLSGEANKPVNSPESIDFPSDTAPYNDVRVRRALFMATDLKSINDSLYGGKGQVVSWPWSKVPGYEDLYLGLDDPEMPASVKELYTYNPDKAKQLLKDAGFPNGFKTKAIMISQYVDFWSIIKDQWAKVGVDLSFDVMETGARTTRLNSGKWGDEISDGGVASVSAFHSIPTLTGTPSANANTSRIFDPKVDQGLVDIRNTIVKDGMKAGMKQTKELMKYVLDQAYAIPVPYVSTTTFWWPWLKDYSGETTIGYYDMPNWVPFTWIDQDLKKSMGH
jgi:peptide/nickel transport system substrate-binding protein